MLRSISKSKSKSSLTISPIKVIAKKTRKKHVRCDDAKKAKCRALGKVCNDATGRCIKIKSK
jgi:hypothetical protein